MPLSINFRLGDLIDLHLLPPSRTHISHSLQEHRRPQQPEITARAQCTGYSPYPGQPLTLTSCPRYVSRNLQLYPPFQCEYEAMAFCSLSALMIASRRHKEAGRDRERMRSGALCRYLVGLNFEVDRQSINSHGDLHPKRKLWGRQRSCPANFLDHSSSKAAPCHVRIRQLTTSLPSCVAIDFTSNFLKERLSVESPHDFQTTALDLVILLCLALDLGPVRVMEGGLSFLPRSSAVAMIWPSPMRPPSLPQL